MTGAVGVERGEPLEDRRFTVRRSFTNPDSLSPAEPLTSLRPDRVLREEDARLVHEIAQHATAPVVPRPVRWKRDAQSLLFAPEKVRWSERFVGERTLYLGPIVGCFDHQLERLRPEDGRDDPDEWEPRRNATDHLHRVRLGERTPGDQRGGKIVWTDAFGEMPYRTVEAHIHRPARCE